MKIPNIDSGLRPAQFEEILRDYVRVRSQEYYKWKDYQYSIQYAGMYFEMLGLGILKFFYNIKRNFLVLILQLKKKY